MRTLIFSILLLFATPLFSAVDENYGLVESQPVKVGGGIQGPARAQAYLARLRGPKGEATSYFRQGSCCHFKTPNALIGDSGLLDRYQVSYPGLAKPIIIYINNYDGAEVFPVKGLKFVAK